MNDEAITLITFVVSLRPRAPTRSFVSGTDSWAPKPTYPQIHFLLGFRAFYFEDAGLLKKYMCQEKVAEMSISGGTSPADFSTAGDASPVPPPTAFSAHAYGMHFKQYIA